MLDSKLGKTRKSFRQFDAEQEAMRDATLAAGYNHDFMEWAAIRGANGAALDNNILAALDRTFKASPEVYAAQYELWIKGK